MDDFYIILNSNHSWDLFENTPVNFKVRLNRSLRLGDGWKVALCQYKSTVPPHVYLCSNICNSTIVGQNQLNVLRYIGNKEMNYTPYYIPIAQHFIDTIHIYMLNVSTDQKIRTDEGGTYITLHFVYKPTHSTA
jgi:hypothetical protein